MPVHVDAMIITREMNKQNCYNIPRYVVQIPSICTGFIESFGICGTTIRR